MSSTPDLSKIVQLIMDNPQLIEAISSLASAEQNKESEPNSVLPAEQKNDIPSPQPPETKASADALTFSARARRAQLLGALKPYISEERAKAIDSMISIAEILEMMKAR